MIWALLIGLFVGFLAGGDDIDPIMASFEAWQEAIDETVENEQREQAAQKIVTDTLQRWHQMRSEAGPALADFHAVDVRYDATIEAYEAEIAKLDTLWQTADEKLIEMRFKLKAVLTQQEWAACLAHVKEEMTDLQQDLMEANLSHIEDHREHKQEIQTLETATD